VDNAVVVQVADCRYELVHVLSGKVLSEDTRDPIEQFSSTAEFSPKGVCLGSSMTSNILIIWGWSYLPFTSVFNISTFLLIYSCYSHSDSSGLLSL
jgi:hypothetical protein